MAFTNDELAGGKVKAFFDRVKVRDLYDISNLGKFFESLSVDEELRAHRTILYYASLSARFPYAFEGRSERFISRASEVESQLIPMLRRTEDLPTLESLMRDAETFIHGYVLPRNDSEKEYLDRFAGCDYKPELLFGEGGVANAAKKNSAALWKLRNLRAMT